MGVVNRRHSMDIYFVHRTQGFGILKRLGRVVTYDLYVTGRYSNSREFESEESAIRFFQRSVDIAKGFDGIPFWINLLSR